MPTSSRRAQRSHNRGSRESAMQQQLQAFVPTDWHALLRGGIVAVLVLVVSFFPHTSAPIATVMRWWWFRLACLLLLVWCVVTGTISPLIGVLLAIVYVCAANVDNVRGGAYAQ